MAPRLVRVVLIPRQVTNRAVLFVGAMTDITERKRRKKRVTSEREPPYGSTEALTHGVAEGRRAPHLSRNGIESLASIQGGRRAGERLQRVHPEDRAKWQGAIKRAIDKKSDYVIEFRILLPDRTVKHVQAVGHPVLNSSGDLLQFVGTSTDITMRKAAVKKPYGGARAIS